MRKIITINDGWTFYKSGDKTGAPVNLPFTWNGKDGQDGGNDYFRGVCTFVKNFKKPDFLQNERVYIEFKGVNSSAKVTLNDAFVTAHDGGYSTFRADITELLEAENTLEVEVDNRANERVYPQTADFTFYGGIYRDVNLITVNENRFDMDYYGASGLDIRTEVCGGDGKITVTAYITGRGEAKIEILDGEGNRVAVGASGQTLLIRGARLWDGLRDPYLYTVRAELITDGETVDRVERRTGFRTVKIDPKEGFFLNGRSYPLRGVSRHQDRPLKGNALTRADHEEDIKIIAESGANTIRLAHYQHDDYFYDLCDEYGMVVWAEIPYISRHMPDANANAVSQMKELIYQQHHHACIAVWGLSNEITMYPKHKRLRNSFHRELNGLVHSIDPSRPTTLACFAMCGFGNRTAHISDTVAWNLYLGWYVPGFFLNDLWISAYHFFYPKSCLGYAEYGAEAMPNLHSRRPRRGDNSEEYQAKYHEYMLKCFGRHPYLWCTYVWNMFDFAADARNQGGEPGMNHKGLVTFDRKTKKDSFYIYKAYWSEEPFVHICGKRFANRTGRKTEVKIYSNQPEVELFVNGASVGKKSGKYVFKFKIALSDACEIRAVSGGCSDECTIKRVKSPDPAYKLHVKSETQSWQK